jgi:hypothetical protein
MQMMKIAGRQGAYELTSHSGASYRGEHKMSERLIVIIRN